MRFCVDDFVGLGGFDLRRWNIGLVVVITIYPHCCVAREREKENVWVRIKLSIKLRFSRFLLNTA